MASGGPERTGSVEGAGVELAYAERGEGPAIVLVHEIGADAQTWAPLAARLAGEARVIAYDRRGYGGSGEPVPYTRTTVEEQAEDAAALIGALRAAPALIAGAGLGALVALDLLRRHRDLASAGAVLIDPPLLQLVPAATEALAAERLELEQALRDHGPRQAVAAHLEARGAGGARVARARQRPRAFFADYGAGASWPVTRAELRALGSAPLAIVTGPATPPHVRAAAEALAELLPGARRDDTGDPEPSLRALLGR